MKKIVLVVVVLAVALAGAIFLREVIDKPRPLVVVQWSNSHPMRPGLLSEMADEYNSANHKTSSGQPIEIELVACDSAAQATDLVSRIKGSGPADGGCHDESGAAAGNPTIVTPQSSDWLVDVNHRAGRQVVDLGATQDIADTWLGIVTYRAMAECLGWPDKEIGYADILALRAAPEGWAKYPNCAQAKWGQRPLLAFTNPNTSTSGRNVLVSLYSIAAGKPPAQLTEADVERDDVKAYVKQFSQLVDHYMPTTIALNTKIAQGPRYGHFFLMPEDNLVSLYKGNEKAIADDGTEQPLTPVKDLVMIHPREGSVLNSNPAGIVKAGWVSPEQADAARDWVDFLRADGQQRKFAEAGFRPARGTNGTVDRAQFAKWGLPANEPRSTIEPGKLAAPVLDKIVTSWPSVKKPAIVTIVADTSGSMAGQKIQQVKDGLQDMIDTMARDKTDIQVGLITFSSVIGTEIAPQPLQQSKYAIVDAVEKMKAEGNTALYDAIKRAVNLTDSAAGASGTTRAVIVLSDGEATAGATGLSDIVNLVTRSEVPVCGFNGMSSDTARDCKGNSLARSDLVGDSLRIAHVNPVQLFFVGFGDADIDIGRVLSQASGAEYQGSTENDLATVIQQLSGYF